MIHFKAESEGVLRALDHYVEGCRTGSSAELRKVFDEKATICGHSPGGLMTEPIQTLYQWIDGNGPSPGVEAQIISVDILDSIAVARLELRKFSGTLAGEDVAMSDAFTLLLIDGQWRIVHKIFHWHGLTK